MNPVLPLLAASLLQAQGAPTKPVSPKQAPARTAGVKKAAPKAGPKAAPEPAKPAAPEAAVAYACTLTLKGSLSRKVSSPQDGSPTGPMVRVEARRDTFEVQVPGTLREVPGADGSVEFIFDPDNSRKATGFVDATVSVVDPSGSEERTFKSREFQPLGPVTFRARYRGQALYAAGTAFNAIGEADVSRNGGPAAKERRLHDLAPLQDFRKDEKDFRAPSLAFTGLSLWALRNSQGGFTSQGAVTYQVNTRPLQLTGRVEVAFQVGTKLP